MLFHSTQMATQMCWTKLDRRHWQLQLWFDSLDIFVLHLILIVQCMLYCLGHVITHNVEMETENEKPTNQSERYFSFLLNIYLRF